MGKRQREIEHTNDETQQQKRICVYQWAVVEKHAKQFNEFSNTFQILFSVMLNWNDVNKLMKTLISNIDRQLAPQTIADYTVCDIV